MDPQTLLSLLQQLHRELSENPPTDDRSRQLLLDLRRDIEKTIALTPTDESTATPIREPSNLRGRLQESIAGLEGSHPQATAALERVLVLLSNFGL